MPIGGSSGGLSSAGPGAGGGAQGPQGATGSQGAQGHQGFQGNQGTQGSGGAQGTQGTQGNTGAQGPQGATGGGGTAGASIVRAFPFAFNTPNILTGAALYTPTIGDILLDAWVEIGTAWDGTTPKCDIGAITGAGTIGWYQWSQGSHDGSLDMTGADENNASPPLLLGSNSMSLRAQDAVANVKGTLETQSGVPPLSFQYFSGQVFGERVIPAKFIAASPICVWVSQDGTNTGADPGSTQGAAVLYLVTATPV